MARRQAYDRPVHEVVVAIGVMFLLVVVTAAVAIGLLAHTLIRSNRVVPNRRSSAPLTWLWSWAAAARLHRRLRRAVRAVAYVIGPLRPPSRGRGRTGHPTSPLVDVADALVARAADVDDRVVAASRVAPRWRSRLLADLGVAVAEVEASVAHLGRVAVTWRTQMDAAGGVADPLPALDLRARLDAVEAALAEVAGVDAGWRGFPPGRVAAPHSADRRLTGG
jgi:hypothetical protein